MTVRDWKDIPDLISSRSDGNGNRRGSRNSVADDDLDAVIADAMQQMSTEDREKVVHEIQ